MRKTWVLLAFLALSPAFFTLADAGEREFISGYAGTLPTDPDQRTGTYFDNPQVRSLVFVLEKGPVSRERVIRELDGTKFTPEELLRVGLLRQKGKKYFLGFNYFTASDMAKVIAVAEKHVPSLVKQYLDEASDFNDIFDLYPATTVPRDRLAFVLIAGFSLNWDGLKITRDDGYRRAVLVEGDGFKYSFWASEILPDHDIHGFYWGSSTFPAGTINYPKDPVEWVFSSFGDPYSDPRMNFPDLLLIPAQEMTEEMRKISERIGLIQDTTLGNTFENVLGLESGRNFATLLLALREHPRSLKDLAVLLSEPTKIKAYLDLLKETGYIEEDPEGTYHIKVPIFYKNDSQLVHRCLALSRQVLSAWLKENYPKMRQELGTLTAMRQGIPFESLFTQIWHEIFGLATRELVVNGFLFDPADSENAYNGSFPTLWFQGLYDNDLD